MFEKLIDAAENGELMLVAGTDSWEFLRDVEEPDADEYAEE